MQSFPKTFTAAVYFKFYKLVERDSGIVTEVIHIIHNFKKFFEGILNFSPCCLHFVHIVFLFVHTYILELTTLFDQFSPQNIDFNAPIHKVIHIIHKNIHSAYQDFIQELSPILSTFSPDSKLYFFLRVCYSILRIIQKYTDAILWCLAFG